MQRENYGWIKLDRKILGHWLWESRPFSDGQAWVDLLLLANSRVGVVRIGEKMLEIPRGGTFRSVRYFAERWGWSPKKVQCFFSVLKKEGMIQCKGESRGTVVQVLNYDTFQSEKSPVSCDFSDGAKQEAVAEISGEKEAAGENHCTQTRRKEKQEKQVSGERVGCSRISARADGRATADHRQPMEAEVSMFEDVTEDCFAEKSEVSEEIAGSRTNADWEYLSAEEGWDADSNLSKCEISGVCSLSDRMNDREKCANCRRTEICADKCKCDCIFPNGSDREEAYEFLSQRSYSQDGRPYGRRVVGDFGHGEGFDREVSGSRAQNLPPEREGFRRNSNCAKVGDEPKNGGFCVKKWYGSHRNVLLSDEDVVNLRELCGELLEGRIEKLSVYKQRSGRRYTDDFATIRRFWLEDEPRLRTVRVVKSVSPHAVSYDIAEFERLYELF